MLIETAISPLLISFNDIFQKKRIIGKVSKMV